MSATRLVLASLLAASAAATRVPVESRGAPAPPAGDASHDQRAHGPRDPARDASHDRRPRGPRDPGRQLAKALSAGGIEVTAITRHEFRDLDGDRIKEVLVRGRGNLRGASVGGALVLTFRGEPAEVAGRPVFLPSRLAWDHFVGVFRFDRGTFRWVPAIIGTYREGELSVTGFRAATAGGTALVHLTTEADGRVTDRLFRLRSTGVEAVFQAERGTWIGEGFWLAENKLFVSRGLENPFLEARPGPGEATRPGFLQKTRYRWDGAGFRPEYWTLGGYTHEATWMPAVPARGKSPAFRRVWQLQRLADRGLNKARRSLEGAGRRRLGEVGFEVAYERDAYGVLVLEGERGPEARYFVRPLFRSRGEEAVWVELGELGGTR